MDIDLSPFFQTKTQAQDFALRLSTISESLYKTEFDVDAAFNKQFGLQKKDAVMSFFSKHEIHPEEKFEFKKFLDQLIQHINSLPVLTLTIAIEPDERLLKALSDWCMINIGKQVIFDTKVEKKLIGGASIYFNGKFFDFSIKPQFDRVFADVMNKESTTSQHNPTTQATANGKVESS